MPEFIQHHSFPAEASVPIDVQRKYETIEPPERHSPSNQKRKTTGAPPSPSI